MKPAEVAPYLEAGDAVLLPLGFMRKKKSQEWRRAVDAAHIEWIHLNFGRYTVINPSFGVQYPDLATLLPAEVGVPFGTMVMLSSSTGRSYNSSDGPSAVADALLSALPELKKLQNRSAVIEALKSEVSADWPVVGRSFRIRLLPLLLATSDRLSEAFDWLAGFEAIAPTIDQIVPGYDVFADHFRKRYQV